MHKQLTHIEGATATRCLSIVHNTLHNNLSEDFKYIITLYTCHCIVFIKFTCSMYFMSCTSVCLEYS